MSNWNHDGRILLHVGYHKAGSSYLQAWFQYHPQCSLGYAGFAGFLSTEQIINDSIRGQLPRLFVLSNEELSGGLETPDGYFHLLLRPEARPLIQINQEKVCLRLKALFPEARVMLVTRGFESSIRAVYSQMVRLGSGLTWSQYLKVYRIYLEHWLNFNQLIGVYERTFGPERVFVLPYELLASNPAAFSALLEELLFLDPQGTLPGVVNPSLSGAAIRLYTSIARALQALTSRLRPADALRVQKLYASLLWSGRLERLLGRWPAKPNLTLSPDYLRSFHGLADALAKRALYQPFLNEYLLSADSSPVPSASGEATT